MLRLSLVTRTIIIVAISMLLLSATVLAGASYVANKDISKLMVSQQTSNLDTLERFLTDRGPLRVDGDNLYAGDTLLNNNFDFIDGVKNIFDVDATVFRGATRIVTTIEKDGKRAVGTKLAAGPVYDAIFSVKKSYYGEADILGVPYLTAYKPIIIDGKVEGVLFVGMPKSRFQGVIWEMVQDSTLLVLPMIGLVIFVIGLLLNRFLAPMKRIQSLLNEVVTQVRKVERDIRASTEESLSIAQRNADNAASVAAGSEETSAQVTSVASATNELSSSVTEILRHVEHLTKTVVAHAQTTTESAMAHTNELAVASTNIGDIIQTITSLADQTNLLALNASIEAARAGDSGRGFAVVADEVKKLASETSQAAESITQQINSMQKKTQQTIVAIENIRSVITEVNNTAQAVSVSVNEQNIATQDISNSLQQTSLGVKQITESISSISESTGVSRKVAENVKTAMDSLGTETDNLARQIHILAEVVQGKSH